MNKREQILNLLEEYPELVRKAALLRYELRRPSTLSPSDMIDAMNFRRGLGEVPAAGSLSNKTMYIALNYREKAEQANRGLLDEIVDRLAPLERRLERLEHYVSLLSPRMAKVLRLYYFEERLWDEIASELGISVRSAQKLRSGAVDKLVEMYDFIEREL